MINERSEIERLKFDLKPIWNRTSLVLREWGNPATHPFPTFSTSKINPIPLEVAWFNLQPRPLHRARQRAQPGQPAGTGSAPCGAVALGPGIGAAEACWTRWMLAGFFDETYLPSGKHTKNYGKIHHFWWVNPLFLGPFSIAMLVYQRVCGKLMKIAEISWEIYNLMMYKLDL